MEMESIITAEPCPEAYYCIPPMLWMLNLTSDVEDLAQSLFNVLEIEPAGQNLCHQSFMWVLDMLD